MMSVRPGGGGLRHALMEENAQSLATELSRDGASAGEVLAALHVYRRVGVDTEGALSIEAGADLPERDGEIAWSETFAATPECRADPEVTTLLAAADHLSPVNEVEVEVSVHRNAWNPRLPVPAEISRGVLEGTVLREDDARAVRAAVLAERAAAGGEALRPVLDVVASWGGEIVSVSALAGLVRVVVPEAALVDLRDADGVTALTLAGDDAPEAGAGYYDDVYGDELTGVELSDLIQATQFYDRGFFGSGQRVALVEGGADNVFADHPGFFDNSGNPRFENCIESGGACSTSYPTSGDAHATAAASILLGDITRGQDPDYTTAVAQAQRSGVARRAEGGGFGSSDSVLAVLGAGGLEDVYVLSRYPDAYEDPLSNLAFDYIYGTDWVDWTSPGDPPGNGPQAFCCTSSAAPSVAGAALLFREWYHDLIGADIDDPGLLYANLLLMGDRTIQNGMEDDDGLRTTSGFDNLWGAGKLRLRMFDDTGLDGPALWGDGTLCVDDGAGVTVNMSSAAHPTVGIGADVLRVVAWWYDDEHDAGEDHARISMTVREVDTSNGAFTQVGNDPAGDNRLRVHLTSLTAGRQYRVRFYGDDIPNGDPVCGANRQLVYYAWFYEDSARTPWEPLPFVRPE